jgi:hypothetical protein
MEMNVFAPRGERRSVYTPLGVQPFLKAKVNCSMQSHVVQTVLFIFSQMGSVDNSETFTYLLKTSLSSFGPDWRATPGTSCFCLFSHRWSSEPRRFPTMLY